MTTKEGQFDEQSKRRKPSVLVRFISFVISVVRLLFFGHASKSAINHERCAGLAFATWPKPLLCCRRRGLIPDSGASTADHKLSYWNTTAGSMFERRLSWMDDHPISERIVLSSRLRGSSPFRPRCDGSSRLIS
jgi:hypothetical protein